VLQNHEVKNCAKPHIGGVLVRECRRGFVRLRAIALSPRICIHSRLYQRPGMNDEPFRCSSNEVKRVARYQRELWTRSGLHNLSVIGINNFRRVDNVSVCSRYGCELDTVAGAYRFKFAEKRVTVRCDCNIAVGAGQWRPRYVPGADTQGILFNTLEDDHRNTDPRNLEPPNNVTFAKIDRLFQNGRFSLGRVDILFNIPRYRAHACALELPRLVALMDARRRSRSAGVRQGGYTNRQKQSLSKAHY
jgi:hypothetical protein